MAPPSIVDLVQRFTQNRDSYTAHYYNETQLRREFLDPFFDALGWDVANRQGYAEAYKEVIHEDAVKVGTATKAPDYSFRIGGVRKFFVEAKKPSVSIKDDQSPAFQLRRYAWSAKLPLSILSNFKEFAVYDCRQKPDKNDKASVARILYITCDEYEKRWDEIADRFTKEAILKGSFDKFATGARRGKGAAQVDDAFLADIEKWRIDLAKNIAIRNPSLSTRQVNFAVQRTIDRLIFLRICEDRGIEDYGRLQAHLNGERIYERFCTVFREADDRYNSGLFHFREEKDRGEAPDTVTLTLSVDDKILREIVSGLYYPESPYEFSVLPADILGQVYEQFLGKVIRLTAGHQAKVEDKPEVRKAGGVFYTPTYIVDYIVKNTVGKLLEGKAPKDAAKLRILDPACGSGSFLIGAYQFLLDWHRDWYLKNDPEKWTNGKNAALYKTGIGEYRLTTPERKRILLNNIYGVDIDTQAVEVTKLSLLLKVLEGETEQTIAQQLKLFHTRALPDLGNNIKCGNSLIGNDFYEGVQERLALYEDEEEKIRINAFDWDGKDGFPEIMKAGGFDAVIGNPPYGFHQIHSEDIKPYFKKYFSSSEGSFEHYFLFYEKSLNLLNSNGLHGFIVPITWLTIPSALSLRKFILDHFAVNEITWLPELVFKNAQVNTLISIIQKTTSTIIQINIYDTLGFKTVPHSNMQVKQSKFIDNNYYMSIFEDTTDSKLIEKITSISKQLSDFCRPCSGYNPYEVGKGQNPDGSLQNQATIKERPYHSEKKLGKEWKQEIIGRDLGRFSLTMNGKRWVKYGTWLAAARDPENFTGKRILIQEITGGKEHRIVATYFNGELYHSRDVIPIKFDNDKINPFYFLGIINSHLLTWYHHRRNPKAQKGLFPKVLVGDISKLPIRPVDLTSRSDKSLHDKMVELVSSILDLNKKLSAARDEQERTLLSRRIDSTDRQIDKLVYELYGLTEEEIKIVEGAK